MELTEDFDNEYDMIRGDTIHIGSKVLFKSHNSLYL